MSLPQRKTPRLRWGRVSVVGATYFVTACTQNRLPVLTHPPTASHILSILSGLHTSADAAILAATIMPDHLHLLFTLGSRLRLGQVVAKLKSLARDQGRADWHWQEDGFEHRLRDHESTEDYAFYVFMNPYNARLVGLHEQWPWWHCPDPLRFRFMGLLSTDATPQPEWLRDVEIVRGRITTS